MLPSQAEPEHPAFLLKMCGRKERGEQLLPFTRSRGSVASTGSDGVFSKATVQVS